MKRQSYIVWLSGALTLGSGLVNLFSVMTPDLPERRAILEEVFPLIFLHVSRFMSLLVGFALIIGSMHIFRRKKLALYMVVMLSLMSVIFHLTKGLDYEEAVLSVVLIVMLLATHGEYRVKSGIPDIRGNLLRLAFTGSIAVLYGIMGFWFLDPREFGFNFTFPDAVRRTFLFLTLVGDPSLSPHTHHARWFLDSLYLVTASFLLYSIVQIFRPVVYRFRIRPLELAEVKTIVERHGRSAQDFFKYWPDKTISFSPDRESFVSYRVSGRFALSLGDPVGSETAIEPMIRRYSSMCRDNDWQPVFHEVLPDFLHIYRSLGFRHLKIGDDAVVDLSDAHINTILIPKFKDTFHKLDRKKLRCEYHEPPLSDDILREARDVSNEWLAIPGRRERGFTLGLFEDDYIRSTPLYTVSEESGRMLAFLNIIPSYREGETTIDLMRRREHTPSGLMDYLFVQFFMLSAKQGFTRFNMGMAPMAGFQEREEASAEERAIHIFFQHMNFIFSYRGLRSYKAKFATSWEPRYLIHHNPLDLPGIAVAINTISTIR